LLLITITLRCVRNPAKSFCYSFLIADELSGYEDKIVKRKIFSLIAIRSHRKTFRKTAT